MTARDAGGFPITQEAYDATLRSLDRVIRENEQLRTTLAHRLQELYEAKWLIHNGEKHFGSLWRDATTEDILAITRRSPPQTAPTSDGSA